MSLPKSCPVCAHPHAVMRAGGSSRDYVCACPRCHTYATTHEFLLFGQDQRFADRKHLLSGLLREMSETGNKMPLVMYKNLEETLNDSRIPGNSDIEAKQQKIIEAVRRKGASFGAPVTLDLETDRSIGYARDTREFIALLKEAEKKGMIEVEWSNSAEPGPASHATVGTVCATLTGDAWKRTEPIGAILVA